MSNLLKLNRGTLQFLRTTKRGYATRVIENPEDYNEKPEYPPILDTSYEARKQRKKERYHEEYKEVGTVEEKLIKINLPKYYGWKSVILNESDIHYNSLGMSQYITRTDLKITDAMPEFYKKNDELVTKIAEKVKNEVEDVIGFEHSGYLKDMSSEASPEEKERVIASNISFQLNRTLINALQGEFSHLNEIEVDLDPRHEAFWFVGGIEPPERIKSYRRGMDWTKKYENDPVDRLFQYLGKPYLAVRHANPLSPFEDVNLDEQNAVKEKVEIPEFKYDPRCIGYSTEYRHGTTIPGFWVGNPNEFGLLSYQRRDWMHKHAKFNDAASCQNALHSHAIHTSFAWLFAQACYQGFTTFNEITYPLTTQTVITDGRAFSFYAYQLNTVLLHSEHATTNPRYNRCWGTKEMKLFEEVDATGKVFGFNDETLKNLIHFYVNVPNHRENIELKPYLDPSCPKIADIQDDLRREWLEKIYKYIYTNRPRHKRVPEIYLWEKIYKIDHKTRPMDKRLRPFELGINPFQRRLDDHLPEYVPRILRPGGYGGRRTGKSKEKWRPTFYPTTYSDRLIPKMTLNYPPQHKYEKLNEEEYKNLEEKYRKKK